MNNKVIINPIAINKLDFKSIGTYKLYFYILSNFDTDLNKVRLEPDEIEKEIFLSRPTISKGMKELLDKNVIEKMVNYRYWYKFNKSNHYGKRKSDNEQSNGK